MENNTYPQVSEGDKIEVVSLDEHIGPPGHKRPKHETIGEVTRTNGNWIIFVPDKGQGEEWVINLEEEVLKVLIYEGNQEEWVTEDLVEIKVVHD